MAMKTAPSQQPQPRMRKTGSKKLRVRRNGIVGVYSWRQRARCAPKTRDERLSETVTKITATRAMKL